MSETPQTAPLQNFKVVGIVEKEVGINAGTPAARMVPGGHCWHCGTEIKVCVQAKNLETGEVVDIGTTCAERIGLDPNGLKLYLAERFAEQRYLRSKAYQDAQQAIYEAKEAEFVVKYGEHGTETRYNHCNVWGNGGYCNACRETAIRLAPHGTWLHYREHRCSCPECVEAAMAHDKNLRIVNLAVLVDLNSGEVVESAQLRSGRYGSFWSLGGYGSTIPAYAKKRETIAKRGYTYARADYLVYDNHRTGGGYSKQRRLSTPTTDEFGVEIPKPVS